MILKHVIHVLVMDSGRNVNVDPDFTDDSRVWLPEELNKLKADSIRKIVTARKITSTTKKTKQFLIEAILVYQQNRDAYEKIAGINPFVNGVMVILYFYYDYMILF